MTVNLEKRLAALRPLTGAQFERLRGMLPADEVAAVYHSNAIEGNSLTLSETALVIESGVTIAGKPLVDHLEALDHIEALHYAQTLAREPLALTQHELRALHSLVLRRSKPTAAGRYRDIPVSISGTEYTPPPPLLVPERMGSVFGRYVATRDSAHPVLVAADLHQGIVDVHPFEDGNGRTARLAMNVHLLQCGFPLTIVEVKDRERYIAAIEAARSGVRPSEFGAYILERVERSLERYLRALGEWD